MRRTVLVLIIVGGLGATAALAMNLARLNDFPAAWWPAEAARVQPGPSGSAAPGQVPAPPPAAATAPAVSAAPPASAAEGSPPGGWVDPMSGAPLPAPPLFDRYVVKGEPCAPETKVEVITEERIKAGPVARFYTTGSRVEESEAYRSQLKRLPLGKEWPWYEAKIEEMGFRFLDATRSARDRPRFELERDGLHFRLEIACDSTGRVTSIDPGPNL
jgi:hypothetical protein